MANIENQKLIVVRTRTQQIEIIKQSFIEYTNTVAGNGSFIRVVNNSNQLKRVIVGGTNEFALRPITSCGNWDPTIRYGVSSDKITSKEFEMQLQNCTSDRIDQCVEDIFDKISHMDQMAQYKAIEDAIIEFAMTDLKNSCYKIGWFGSSEFGKDGEVDLTKMDVELAKKAVPMMRESNGIFHDLRLRGQLMKPNQNAVTVVNTNDGTLNGNVLSTFNVSKILKKVLLSASYQLKNRADKLLLVSPDIFQTLCDYYEFATINNKVEVIQMGMWMRDTIQFEGVTVVSCNEWKMFDEECRSIDPQTGHSLIQRIVFTCAKNLAIIVNPFPVAGHENNESMVISKGANHWDAAITFASANVEVGGGVVEGELCVLGYNDSKTFIYE